MLSSATDVQKEFRFGRDLEAYLAELSQADVDIQVADRVALNALAAELIRHGAIASLEDFKPYMRAVLARAPEQGRLFATEHAASTAEVPPDGPDGAENKLALKGGAQSKGQRQSPHVITRRTWLWASMGAALILLGVLTWSFGAEIGAMFTQTTQDEATTQRPAYRPTTTDPSIPQTNAAPQPETKVSGPAETVARILDAAAPFDGAPTLVELASRLEPDAALQTTPAKLARALHELTGAPLHQPLDLLGIGPENAVAWAPILARALDRMERPDQVTSPSAYEITGSALEEHANQLRAALTPEQLTTRTQRASTQKVATPVPTWLAPLVAIIPILLGVLWLLIRFFSERAYLRRRRPKRPPNRTEFFAEALAKAFSWTPTDRRVAQMLMLREEREIDRLDVRRTIDASLAQGGCLISLQNERLRPLPEYLVLIEEQRGDDHGAQRLRDLLTPYRKNANVHFDVYTYQHTPTMLRTEDGRTLRPLEAVRAMHPEHRLIILGTGHDFVAFEDGQPRAFVDILTAWQRRVVLTPQPLAEWGRREFLVADALACPVGRATRNGFRTIGDLLGLDAVSPPDPGLRPEGDGRLAELPDSMRLAPQRLLYEDPPNNVEVDDLLRDLGNYLDRDGFRWLSALAVFPAIQWDITLYLGLRLPTERDLAFKRDDREEDLRQFCYRDDAVGERRLSALSRLPWLRNGHMPDWLREALLDRLSDTDRGEIYRAIDEALESAEQAHQVSGATDRMIRIKIGRDTEPARLGDYEPRQDELLLEFLERGDRCDYPLPAGFENRYRRQSNRFLAAGRNQRIAVISLIAGLLAWAAVPSTGMITPTGAWWPLLTVSIGALIALAMELGRNLSWRYPRIQRPRLAWRRTRRRPVYAEAQKQTHTQAYTPGTRFSDRLSDGGHGPEMVVVPAGRFLMGSPDDEEGRHSNEGPQHEVVIKQPFAVGIYAISFDEWDKALAAGGVTHKPDDQGWGRGRRPVINVAWHDAQEYITWLARETGETYRLLTEAEWEYVARAGTSTPFWWGNEISTEQANYNGNSTYMGGAKGSYREQTVLVDSFDANPWGLYQVHGNVWEWCADTWHDTYVGAPTDGSIWHDAKKASRVLRGGSWYGDPQNLRSAVRVWDTAVDRYSNNGFRVAKTLPLKP